VGTWTNCTHGKRQAHGNVNSYAVPGWGGVKPYNRQVAPSHESCGSTPPHCTPHTYLSEAMVQSGARTEVQQTQHHPVPLSYMYVYSSYKPQRAKTQIWAELRVALTTLALHCS